MHYASLENITKSYGIRVLFRDISLHIEEGDKVALIARNGTGKSTLLNALLNEERAIVSDIAGTTRDTVEEAIQISGILFRFIDTAGIRHETDSEIERIGIQRALEKVRSSAVVIYLFDAVEQGLTSVKEEVAKLELGQAHLLRVANKTDHLSLQERENLAAEGIICISAKEKHIEPLIDTLTRLANEVNLGSSGSTVSNVRHLEALTQTRDALEAVLSGLGIGLSGDLLAEDIRRAIYHLGSITGQISSDDILGNIFGKFCIGK